MLLQDGTLATGSWADTFVRSQAQQEEALRQQQQNLQAEIWQADLELQARSPRENDRIALPCDPPLSGAMGLGSYGPRSNPL